MDRVVIVTGAGQGLGREHALAFGRHGARVVVNDVGDAAAAVAGQIRAAGGTAVASSGDVSDWGYAQSLVQRAVAEFGALHALVNNAGINRDRMLVTMTEDEWDTVLRVDLKGHFAPLRHAAAYWRERNKHGEPVAARIVSTSSGAGMMGSVGQGNYAAAKAGIAALTVSTARGCAKYGVRANAICPRARTAMLAGLVSAAPADGPDPLAPEHVAPLVTYLAGPAAERINGEVFVVHGGVAAVMNPPSIRAVFHAATPDGMWTLPAVHDALAAEFSGHSPGSPGFACTETMSLATETIGFD
jgi:NAD(P)-dependent dehydrogenase (short-subunit alcohol dehydrogenase family)